MPVEQATEQTTISASPDRCFDIALDFDRYTEWAGDIKQVTVLERDDHGRGTKVAFRAGALGQSISYTLAYNYNAAPGVLSWVQVEGDITRQLDGSYIFDADGFGNTRMTYNLIVELKVPLLGFIKRRAEHRILHTALRDLKARVESLPS